MTRRMKVDPRMAAQLRGDGVLDVGLVDDDFARCARCGCTDGMACPGGCEWIPVASLEDVCSSCATPEELWHAGYDVEVTT